MHIEHLNTFKPELTKEIDDVMSETLYFTLTNVNFNFNDHIKQLMKVGSAGVKVMEIYQILTQKNLVFQHLLEFLKTKLKEKLFLVSGHDLEMFEKLLIATEG